MSGGASDAIVKVELRESSGPVAPKLRYGLTLTLERMADDGARLHVVRTGTESGTHAVVLSSAEADTLFDELDALGLSKSEGNFIGNARNNKGISFNALLFTSKDGTTRVCEYLLTSLEEPHFPGARVIERLREVARSAQGIGSHTTLS